MKQWKIIVDVTLVEINMKSQWYEAHTAISDWYDSRGQIQTKIC